MALSFRMTSRSVLACPASFNASNAMPQVSEPSPMIATTRPGTPCSTRARAMPSAAEIEVPPCPASKASCSLSSRLANPDRPSNCRNVAKLLAPPGEQFVRVNLMADIPDETIARAFEHVMERQRQFDDTQIGAKMPAGLCQRVQQKGAYLFGKVRELFAGNAFQIFG